MAKEILRANSELLKTFYLRAYRFNCCPCRASLYFSSFTPQQSNPIFSLSCRSKYTKNTKSEKHNSKKDINSLVQPVSVKPYIDPDGINVGEELSGLLKKGGICWFFVNTYMLKRGLRAEVLCAHCVQNRTAYITLSLGTHRHILTITHILLVPN